MVGRGRVYVPFHLSDLREIKKGCGQLCWCPRPIHLIHLDLCDANFELTWKDIMLLLQQTLSSLEKQWILAQATQVGNDCHLQWALIPMAPENECINVPIPTGAQVVPLADPHWSQNGQEDEWHWCHFIHLIVEGLKRGQSQTSKLFQGDCSTARPWRKPPYLYIAS
jgi:hypothetical protein